MEEDFGVALELICSAFNIRKEVCGIYPFGKKLMKKRHCEPYRHNHVR
jgi:hypothetical protein